MGNAIGNKTNAAIPSRPQAEKLGITKMGRPIRWNPPQTPLASHFRKGHVHQEEQFRDPSRSSSIPPDGEGNAPLGASAGRYPPTSLPWVQFASPPRQGLARPVSRRRLSCPPVPAGALSRRAPRRAFHRMGRQDAAHDASVWACTSLASPPSAATLVGAA